MGYIKEPNRIDFIVDPKPVTESDKKMISEVIAFYKKTGKKKVVTEPGKRRSRKREKLVK